MLTMFYYVDNFIMFTMMPLNYALEIFKKQGETALKCIIGCIVHYISVYLYVINWMKRTGYNIYIWHNFKNFKCQENTPQLDLTHMKILTEVVSDCWHYKSFIFLFYICFRFSILNFFFFIIRNFKIVIRIMIHERAKQYGFMS